MTTSLGSFIRQSPPSIRSCSDSFSFYRLPLVSSHLCAFASSATALPLQNITLPLPFGTTNHGTPGLLCTPAKWTNIVLFYLFNYVAHAATVITKPGERSSDFLACVVGSLLLPALGLYRGIEAILSGAVFARKYALRMAARSGALCTVVRGRDWRPAAGDEVESVIFKRAKRERCVVREGVAEQLSVKCEDACPRSLHLVTYTPPWLDSRFQTSIYVRNQTIHGTHNLPEGYRFVIVPADARFESLSNEKAVVEVSATHNIVKAMIALVQSGYAIATLYRSRGGQISQFGYYSFGLTVAPYAVMSVVNLIDNLCRPDYASLYLVENSIMEEARKRGGVFSGAVGRVCEEKTPVCGCGLTDGDDVEQIQFQVDKDGELRTNFGVTAPPEVYRHCRDSIPSSIDRFSGIRSSALSLHSHTIEPLPKPLDYRGKGDDAVLLIPCCNPIVLDRSPQIVPLPGSPKYRLSGFKVCRPMMCLHRRDDWVPTFVPTLTFPYPHRWKLIKYAIATLVAFAPLIIYGGMSRFHSGSIIGPETVFWKVYTMQWLLLGTVSGLGWAVDHEGKDSKLSGAWQYGPVAKVIVYVLSANPAIGGFVAVGQMLMRYGVCVWVGN